MVFSETERNTMFRFFKQEEKPSILDPLIEELASNLKDMDVTDEDYPKTLDALRTLVELKATEPRKRDLSPDTAVAVGGNLAGVVMVLMFEAFGNIIASKALNLIHKPRT